jgi:hypothetical protein
MKKTSHTMFFVLIPIVLLLLTGCGADIDQSVTFYRGEAWETDMSFSIDAETLALFSDPAELEAELDNAVQEAESRGAKASWDSRRQDTTLIYTIHVKGNGLEMLNDIAFDSRAQLSVSELDGKRQIFISYPVRNDFLSANQYTLTINAGEIISTNGREIKKGTVQWTNPSGRVEAVLTAKGGFSLVYLLEVVVLVIGLGGLGWFLMHFRGQQQTAVFCGTCGQSMAPQAQFCPKCGQKRSV